MNLIEYNLAAPRLLRALAAIHTPRNVRVLFVCLGNICRSPAAEGLMLEVIKAHNDSGGWTIDSAGTGDYHVGDLPDSRMRAHAMRRGIRLTHICRQIRESDFDNFDLIIGMDDANLRNLHRIAPTPADEQKILGMNEFFSNHSNYDHVPDPYYDGAQGFETVLDLLTEATCNLYDTVRAAISRPN